jgi:hypothetical protein
MRFFVLKLMQYVICNLLQDCVNALQKKFPESKRVGKLKITYGLQVCFVVVTSGN